MSHLEDNAVPGPSGSSRARSGPRSAGVGKAPKPVQPPPIHPPPKPVRLVVGLGNPGAEYARTRHNAGFMVLDRLAARLGLSWRERQGALVAEMERGGRLIWLMKPLSYMNLSGEPVKKLCRREGLLPEEVLAVYDDLALPCGRVRLRYGGSSGGHNGIKSLLSVFGQAPFSRVRIGIDHPGQGADVADYVLRDFTAAESCVIIPIMERAADAVLMLCDHGQEAAMNAYNGQLPPPASDS